MPVPNNHASQCNDSGPVLLAANYTPASSVHTNGTPDPLFTDTIPAGQMSENGDLLIVRFSATFVGSPTATRTLGLKIGATFVTFAGPLQDDEGGNVVLEADFMRGSASTVQFSSSSISTLYDADSAGARSLAGNVTGLDFTVPIDIAFVGVANGVGAAPGDITAQIGSILFIPAP